MKNFPFIFILVCIAIQAISQDKIPDVMMAELNRNMDALKKGSNAPYFMSYRVNEKKTYRIVASFGEILQSKEEKERKLCVQVRVGSPKLDNTHPIKGEDYGWFDWDRGITINFDNAEESLRQALWQETDKQYRKASDMFNKVQANVAIKVADEDKSEDFSSESPFVYTDVLIDESKVKFDVKEWEEKLKKYSSLFLVNKDIQKGEASFSLVFERKYFVSSEGSKITENRVTCRLYVDGELQADDGMELPLYNSYFSFEPKDLASDSLVTAETKKLVETLGKLKTAPIVDSYTGPALLASASAGVFFHEIFGHRIEAQRMKNEEDAQTFKKKVGQKVLNQNLSVIFDPTITKYKNFFMNGAYKYDDQGQPGQKTIIVDKGMLKNFLVSRTPIDGFLKSNGHGRAQEGMQAVSRQSNLIVETNNPKSMVQLRAMLIEEAKKQGKEFGYLFVNTVGGFTTTGRYMPNSFNVTPTEVYRIYVDGRPDELVRGVDLVGTPLSIFSNIEAAGDDPGIFTGTCGAESGMVPTTTVCPSLFVKQIETQRKPKKQSKAPILSRP